MALLDRIPLGDAARRALAETLADWRYESRDPNGPGRARATLSAVAAIIRVVLATCASPVGSPMRHLGFDVRHGLRRLRATPAFTLFAVASLGLGIGAATAIYSMMRAVTAPPPGVRDVETVVNVYHSPGGGLTFLAMSWPDYQALSTRTTTLEHVTGTDFAVLPIVGDDGAHDGRVELVGGEYFPLLGVNAAMGRALQPFDDRPDAPPAAVLSDLTWRRLFGGRADVVGRTVRVGTATFEIAGVAPPEFRGTFNSGLMPTSVWIPLAAAERMPRLGAEFGPSSERRWVLVRGRLMDGHTIDEAAAEVTAIAEQLDLERPIGADIPAQYASRSDTSRRWTVQSMGDVLMNENMNTQTFVRVIQSAILAGVVLVLLVACTNLANLTLARGTARQAELAIRQSLGASRWRLFREAVVEQSVVALAGGVVGLAVARVVLLNLGGELRVVEGATLALDPRLDLAALAACLGASMLALLVAGVVPSLQVFRQHARAALAAHGGGGALPRWRGRRALIAFQVTVALVLLSLASTFAAQLREAARADSGVDVDRLAVALVDVADQPYDQARVDQIVDAYLAQLSSRDDVEAVAVSAGLPFGLGGRSMRVRDLQVPVPDGALPQGDGAGIDWLESVAATPGLFDTLGVPILRGRGVEAGDTSAGEPVIVVSERAARTLFASVDVVGRTVEVLRQSSIGGSEEVAHLRRIVGVAADTDAGVAGRRDRGVAYVPLAQLPHGQLVFSARANADAGELAGVIRSALLAVEPGLVISRLGTGPELVAPANPLARAAVAIAGVLGFFAMVLAVAGLYGVLSHVIARRTREIGLRIALGATPRRIVAGVVRDGLRPVLIGLGVGVGLSTLARLTVQPRFLSVLPAGDPASLLVVSLVFLAVALAAAYVPASRAARVDPQTALKEA